MRTAAWGRVLADGRVACGGFRRGLGFPASHEVVAGQLGIAVRPVLAFGKNFVGLSGCGQCGL